MKNILVIGEVCLDIYNYCDCTRLSPEAPVPIAVPIQSEITANFGMAMNVANNLSAQFDDDNVRIFALTQLTNSTFLTTSCTCGDVLSNKDFKDMFIVKERFVDKSSNNHLLRIDSNDSVSFPLTSQILIDFFSRWNLDWKNISAVVVSDYNKGFLTTDILKRIFDIACNHSIPIFLDTKKTLGEWSSKVTFVKINDNEYDKNLRQWPYANLRLRPCQNLIVTRGGNPTKLVVFDDETLIPYISLEVPVAASQVRDVVGAGDTFLAALVSSYIESRNIHQAIIHANACAALSVSSKGVVVVKADVSIEDDLNKTKLVLPNIYV